MSSAQAAAPLQHPVVLELFTSQGCSSCPPADGLLNELAVRDNVLALSYHITYWNSLGWQDPLSFDAATARQNAYGIAMGHAQVYTPQLVVQGSADVIGSSRGKVEDALAQAGAKGGWVPVTLQKSGGKLVIHAAEQKGVSADVILLGYIRQSHNEVPRGENAGSTLHHRNSVISIEALSPWNGGALDAAVPLPKGDGVAVLLQQPGSGAILGAGWLQ